MDSPRIATAPAHSCAGSIVAIFAFVRTRSAGPCAGESVAGYCARGAAPDFAAEGSTEELAVRAAISIAAHMTPMKNVRRCWRDILGLDPSEGDRCQEQALQTHFAAGGVVPLGGGVRAAAFSAAAE